MDKFDPEAPRRVIGQIGGEFYADEWRGVGETLRRTRKGPHRPTMAEALEDVASWVQEEDPGAPSFIWISSPASPMLDFER